MKTGSSNHTTLSDNSSILGNNLRPTKTSCQRVTFSDTLEMHIYGAHKAPIHRGPIRYRALFDKFTDNYTQSEEQRLSKLQLCHRNFTSVQTLPSSKMLALSRVQLRSRASESGIVLSLIGNILLRNITFQKVVTLRYSQNEWKTYHEVQASFSTSRPGNVDEFKFELPLTDQQHDNGSPLALVDFAIRYEFAGQTHWDNNGSQNYRVGVSAKPVETETLEPETQVTKSEVASTSRYQSSLQDHSLSILEQTPSLGPQSAPIYLPSIQIYSAPVTISTLIGTPVTCASANSFTTSSSVFYQQNSNLYASSSDYLNFYAHRPTHFFNHRLPYELIQ